MLHYNIRPVILPFSLDFFPYECYIKTHENTNYIIKTFFFCTCDPDDVRDLFFLLADRRSVRSLKL